MPKIWGAKSLSADDIRAVVSGTAGEGKAILDDGASGLEWGTVAGSSGYTPSTKTTTYTITTSDNYIRCNHATVPFTVTLPAATGSGIAVVLENIGAAAVTAEGDGSDTIDDLSSIVLRQNEWTTLIDVASGAWREYAHTPRTVILSSRTGTHQTSAATVDFNTISQNDGNFTEDAGIYTCVSPGPYRIIPQVGRTGSVSYNGIAVRKNSTVIQTNIPNPLSTTGPTMVLNVFEKFAIGDTFDVQNYPSGSSSVIITESFLKVIKE